MFNDKTYSQKMDKTFIIAVTLIIYKLVLITIGWTARKQTKSIVEYFLGGKKIGPLITAISYSASNSSAWTLLGVSGIAYKFGLSTLWLVLGVIIGMFFYLPNSIGDWMERVLPFSIGLILIYFLKK